MSKKLQLNKETQRVLSQGEYGEVAGGATAARIPFTLAFRCRNTVDYPCYSGPQQP